MNPITRRAALSGPAALAALSAVPAFAKAPMLGPVRPMVNRVRLGGFEITTILDGAVAFKGPYPVFGANTFEEDVQDFADTRFLPTSRMEISFTPVLVNTGAELILFDTGNGGRARPKRGNLAPLLAEAGYTPEQVDVVVITHFHPDHIGGVAEGGAPVFPNARYVAGAVEYDFWSPEDKLSGPTARVAKLAQANVVPFAERMTFLSPGDAVASGIEAVGAFGHTPGMLAFHIESEGQRLMLIADTANHFALALERPDWHLSFDMDKAKAVSARREVLGMIAADRIPFTGYHMPFPALGWLEAKGDGFAYVPASYQFTSAG